MQEEKIINKQIVEVTLKYFFWDLKVRSQTQHRDLVSDFRAFIRCFSDLSKEYEPKLKLIIEKPIVFFMNHNPQYFKTTERKKIDPTFTLSNLDFLYFRDTSFNNQLKTAYNVDYSRPTSRHMKKLTLSHLLDITAFIRDTLYNDVIKIASENDLEVPLMLPRTEKYSQEGVGIEQKAINF